MVRVMDHKCILERIGHYTVIARKLGVHPSTVSRWKSEGIPRDRWEAVRRLARNRHLPGITVKAIRATAPARNDQQPVS